MFFVVDLLVLIHFFIAFLMSNNVGVIFFLSFSFEFFLQFGIWSFDYGGVLCRRLRFL